MPKESLETLISELVHEEDWRRMRATAACLAGGPKAVEGLIHVLETGPSPLKIEAAGMLARGRAVRADALAAELASDQVRSLLPGRLVDVPSSDRHNVKPWFAWKLAFSPPVPDLSAEGFPLAGGRIDVLAGRQAAALVYHRRLHVINVYVCAANGAPGEASASTSSRASSSAKTHPAARSRVITESRVGAGSGGKYVGKCCR